MTDMIALGEFIVSVTGRLYHYPCHRWVPQPSEPTLENLVRAATDHQCPA